MKTYNRLSALENSILTSYQLSAIRGGTSGGGSTGIDEDILIPDPEPAN
jgi:hypothetical protein